MTDPTYRAPERAPERDEFTFHRPSAEGAAQAAAVRGKFRELRDWLVENVPLSRLRASAITDLGHASRAAVAAAVLSHPDSEPVEE